MESASKAEFIPEKSRVQSMFGDIAGRYDLANSVMSLGTHYLWKRQLIHSIKACPGDRALDLCTGTGDLLPLLTKYFRNTLGADFCLPMLVNGKKRNGFQNFTFLQADALSLPFLSDSFDVVTVSFGVRNFEETSIGLKECFRVLASGGTLAILEFGQPAKGVWGSLYDFYSKHCMPLIGGLLTGNREAYTYLPETSKKFPCGEKFEAILKDCGFAPQKTKSLFGGIAFIYLARKP